MKRIFVLLLTLSILLLTACAGGNGKTPAANNPKEPNQAAPSENEQTQEAEEDVGPMEIKTSYGSLYYPGKWGELLQTEQVQDGDALNVAFRTEISGNKYDLFRVTIAPQEGDSVGTVTGEDGTKRNVFIEVYDMNVDNLSKEDQDTLFAMQEGVNDLIDALDH